MVDDLLIKDQYTIDQIGSYQILGNKYAMDLELHNLGDMKKLDSIKFIKTIKDKSQFDDCKTFNDKNFKLCTTSNGNYVGISTISLGHKILGYILTTKKYHPTLPVTVEYNLLLILMTVIGAFLFNFVFLFLSMKKRIENNTKSLIDFISSEKCLDNNLFQIDIEEYKIAAQIFMNEKNEIAILQKDKMYYEAKKIIAEQVAHDIRSPLAAINTVLSDVITIQENKRIIIRNAAKRINDIANNLLFQHKDNNSGSNNSHSDDIASPELMFVVLDNIVSEKRFEYQKSEINIQLEIEKCSYNCFSDINLASFKRVLSNLINNSIEAVKTEGSVVISLKSSADHIEIIIEDNGCGIPSEILPEILKQGFSFNKKNGAGLGLFSANKYISQLGGKLTIHSEVDVGTKITISLTKSTPPHWFCESLNIDNHLITVVLDDDTSIHDAWNDRFNNISCKKLTHFYKASDLLNKNADIANQAGLYLIDYELLADEKNGLDVIEQLNLNNKSILVTSCFEDKDVRNRSRELGVKILPKAYVPYIPLIQLKNPVTPKKVIFIDNDELMRDTWMFSAKAAGVDLSVYSSVDEFMNFINQHEKNSIIYIDSELDTQIKGEIHAKELFDRGYTEIHIATGHSLGKIGNIPWIKSIVGKEPPFLSKRNFSY